MWADEFGGAGIEKLNAIAVGPTDTPGAAAIPGVLEAGTAITTLGLLPEPSEIARAVVFLSPPAASYVNGAVLHATGGQRGIAA